jgi:hypothetical protein
MLALALSFLMGFTVTTAHPTNVVVRYKTACGVTGGVVRYETHQFEAQTPIARRITYTAPGIDFCRIRVVAWDRGPWFNPHHGQQPEVHAWVQT